MIKVKNVRPGILIIADAGIKLAPGETTDVRNVTAQTQRCLDDGLLARVDAQAEAQPNAKSAARSNAAKGETSRQPARAASTKPKSGADGSDGAADKSATVSTSMPVGSAGAKPATAESGQSEPPGGEQ